MKEKRQTEVPSKDPLFTDASFTYNNTLSIPEDLKKYLTDKGLDWRFLNATQFRQNGNHHRSHWKPFTEGKAVSSVANLATAEGLIQRGDLILGVRPKSITTKHREFLKEKNKRYANFSKETAKEMRADIRRSGMSGVSVDEGYDEDEKGFKGREED